MGRGDIRTKRGKISRGTHGKTRPRKKKPAGAAPQAAAKPAPRAAKSAPKKAAKAS